MMTRSGQGDLMWRELWSVEYAGVGGKIVRQPTRLLIISIKGGKIEVVVKGNCPNKKSQSLAPESASSQGRRTLQHCGESI